MTPHLLKKVGRVVAVSAMATTLCISGFTVPAQAAVTPNPIDTNSRAMVSKAYKERYVPALSTPINWTGNVETCNPGTQSAESRAQEANVINFYRGLNGLDSIRLDANLNARAQSTALMMHANQQLSHFPPTTWKCYDSTGASNAGKSNIFGGAGFYKIPDASAPIKSYMDDYGVNNTAVGHRRWILNPTVTTMGTGTTSSYNALTVIGTGTNANYAKPDFIPFPNAGYSPAQLEPFGRWSLSTPQDVDFTGAVVSVSSSRGENLSVKTQPVQNGYGPNTLVFEVSGVVQPTGREEINYTVTVQNMKKNGQPFSYTYTTKLFDANVASGEPEIPNFINSQADIVTYDANGTLWNYGTLNPYSGRKQIGSVLPSAIPKDLFVTDWNNDGIYDLIAQTKDGYIQFHKGLSGGGFSTSTIGYGWQNFDITVGKWKKQDKYPSIIARNNATGELFNYTNPEGTYISYAVRVGTGWNGLGFHLVDWDKDGNIDVFAKNADGHLLLYRTNGAGAFLVENHPIIGTGWNIMNHIKVLNGHNGGNSVGLLARDTAGGLWYYQVAQTRWDSAFKIGEGWNGYLIAGN